MPETPSLIEENKAPESKDSIITEAKKKIQSLLAEIGFKKGETPGKPENPREVPGKPEVPEVLGKPQMPEIPGRPSQPKGLRIKKPETPGKPDVPGEGQSSQPGGNTPGTNIPQTGGNELPTSPEPTSPDIPTTPGHIGIPDTGNVSPGTGENPLGL